MVETQRENLTNYNTQPWTGVFNSTIIECLEYDPIKGKTLLIVWMMLAKHADKFGLVFEGVRPLMTLGHYSQTTIERSLAVFSDLDWIRQQRFVIPTTGETVRRWQLSPERIALSPRHAEHAWNLWFKGTSLCRNETIHAQESESRIRVQNQNPDSSPDKSPEQFPQRTDAYHPKTGHPDDDEKNREGRDQDDPENDSAKHSALGKAETQREAHTAVESPPGSAQPPHDGTLPPIEVCKTPLDDDGDENLAYLVVAELGTRLPQARQLIKAYGSLRIKAGMAFVQAEVTAGKKIRSKVGYMRKVYLEKQSEGKPAGGKDGSKYVSGKYADMIEH